jgi:hypothetical protein
MSPVGQKRTSDVPLPIIQFTQQAAVGKSHAPNAKASICLVLDHAIDSCKRLSKRVQLD